MVTRVESGPPALGSSDHRLGLLIEHLPLAYIEFDQDVQLLNWNPEAEHIFGHTKQEALGKSCIDLLEPALSGEYLQNILERIFAGDFGVDCVCQNVTKHGHVIVCHWRNTPIIGVNGKVIGAFAVGQDITVQQCPTDTRIYQANEHDAAMMNQLTTRQRSVLRLVVEGHRTKEIARAIEISVKTVEMHRANIMQVLGIHDIPGLVRFAIRAGLISPHDETSA
jgi:PAS domain S-box-containing protein